MQVYAEHICLLFKTTLICIFVFAPLTFSAQPRQACASLGMLDTISRSNKILPPDHLRYNQINVTNKPYLSEVSLISPCGSKRDATWFVQT